MSLLCHLERSRGSSAGVVAPLSSRAQPFTCHLEHSRLLVISSAVERSAHRTVCNINRSLDYACGAPSASLGMTLLEMTTVRHRNAPVIVQSIPPVRQNGCSARHQGRRRREFTPVNDRASVPPATPQCARYHAPGYTATGALIAGQGSYPSTAKSSYSNAKISFLSGLIIIFGRGRGSRESWRATWSK